ncbi:G-type lectin S-receptor-like serine/threonine-protein kinase At1g11330 [Lotus japonicus]|uniref:G-type lectin S-receptor-like serine/threonine-protein kinase At1g11330 n=1 Tax=Lotus japonicus TaxID=34305 RepID=UPI00258ADE07|nr:G-type lectin S-receptor-like serine/threonine-protein kinase At1g11330 [Lotus japonicus]
MQSTPSIKTKYKSSSRRHKLGFFTPENSTNRYVAIWHISQSYKDGNLVILNAQNRVIWSTNISISSNSTRTAQILDSGNLILRDDETGETVWDTYSHPSGSAVPGMRIATNRITLKKIQYTTWKNSTDPSSGYFTASLERLDTPEVFFWRNKTHPYWRTGPRNGRVFLGAPRMLTEYLAGWEFQKDDGHGNSYLTYNYGKQNTFGILHMTSNGSLQYISFYNKIEINHICTQNVCDFYVTCGAFGNSDASSDPIYSCFEGFRPRDAGAWSAKNWTGGCVRTAELRCVEVKNGSEVQQDGFLLFNNMKVPDFAERSDGDQDKCGRDCLGNCSCLAYGHDPYIGCMYWSRDLIDLQKFPSGGVDLFIRVPAELVKGKGGNGNMKLIIAISVAIGAVTLAVCSYILWRKFTAKPTGSQPQFEDHKEMKLHYLPLFDFETLATATKGFHLGNVLGKGGCGSVYKGDLEDGQEIAVKRLSKASGQGLEEFMNEVVVISKLQHRNLVRLLGCCVERDEQILVYEFMPNKSLDAFLFG